VWVKIGVGIAAVAIFLSVGAHGSAAVHPPRVVTKSASEVGMETATLRGIAKPRKSSATYWFVYGLSKEYGGKTFKKSIGLGERALQVSALIDDLSPGTTYHFRIVVRNHRGTRKGRDRLFTTLPGEEKGSGSGSASGGGGDGSTGGAGGGGSGGDGGGGKDEVKGWSLQTTPNPGGFGNNLETVSCLSSTECIAAGESNGPMAERWDGAGWSPMPTPAAWVEVDSVSCTSSVACTAVGHTETSTFVMRWDGTEWKIQKSPNKTGASHSLLHGVSCTSATFCVAVGNYQNDKGWYPLAEVWDGTEWKIQEMPSPIGTAVNYVYDVSCTSSTACTAVGYTPHGTLAERWDGGEWKVQKTPPGGSGFDGVSCTSSMSCIAVGHTLSIEETYAARWNGTEWKTLGTLNPPGALRAELSSVSCVSISACAAVGWFETEAGTGKAYTLAEIWNGSEWEIESTPNPPGSVSSGLQDVSCVAPFVCEAVGRYNAGPILGFAERYE
jgi:hypothetical protein